MEDQPEWMRRQELRGALAEWLPTLNFDYFLTVTFRDPVPAYRSFAALRTVSGVISRGEKPRNLFLATEPHVLGSIHVHGLYARRSQSAASEPDALWSKLFASLGRSSVARIRSTEDVATYCTKYVLKGLTDYLIE